ncbi:MAG: GntR family transcriptional regulator, transcriptional repressor for pyruvate dehydrogenase complex [Solirubrobacteraceae bacterium]
MAVSGIDDDRLGFEPVKRVRAYELILGQIERRILGGELQEGDRLGSEREMIAQFHVSRSTLREALRVAESAGLIEVRKGDPGGPRVIAAPFRGVSRTFAMLLEHDVSSLSQLVELRMALEGVVAFQCAQLPRALLDGVRDAFAAMHEASDDDAFALADIAFHFEMAEAAGNPSILLIVRALREPMVAAIKLPLSTQGSARARRLTIGRHQLLLDAVLAGDGARARAASHRGLFDNYAPEVSSEERRRLRKILVLDGGDEIPSPR